MSNDLLLAILGALLGLYNFPRNSPILLPPFWWLVSTTLLWHGLLHFIFVQG